MKKEKKNPNLPFFACHFMKDSTVTFHLSLEQEIVPYTFRA